MQNDTTVQKTLTVAYAAGPGDVIGTYRYWVQGSKDPNEVSEAFSGLFYQVIRDSALSAYVVSSHARQDIHAEDWITIEHRPRPSGGKSGLAYHFAELAYWLGVFRSMIGSKACVAIIDDMVHWWLLSLLRLASVHVIPDLHSTMWPRGYRPSGLRHRLLHAMNGWFWRHIPVATICVSPECERQVREISGPRVKGDLIQARSHYVHGYLDTIPEADWDQRPFRLLFAGRIEESKGIYDLLSVVERIQTIIPGGLVVEVCGSGSAEKEFVNAIAERNLGDIVHFKGRLDRSGMRDAYSRAHAVLVPTLSSFAEGLNRVVMESVLSGRPVVATTVCNTQEVFEQSAMHVRPGDVDAMADAILKLACDRDFYEGKRAGCKYDETPFYDLDQSWGAAVGKAIEIGLKHVKRGTSLEPGN